MAVTATAQKRVQDDVIRSLGMLDCTVITQSFNRPNLHYEVRPKLARMQDDMVDFIRSQRDKACGIVYCLSQATCENVARVLRDKYSLRAEHYHAGMTKEDRKKAQEGWQEHNFEIIVATVSPFAAGRSLRYADNGWHL